MGHTLLSQEHSRTSPPCSSQDSESFKAVQECEESLNCVVALSYEAICNMCKFYK